MIKKCLHTVANKKTIPILLLIFVFMLSLITVLVIRYKGVFLSDHSKGLQANTKEIHGSYYTVDFRNLDTYSLAQEPGRATLNGKVPRRRIVHALRSTQIDGQEYIEVEYGGITGWMKNNKTVKVSDEKIGFQKGTNIFICVNGKQKAKLYPDHAWNKEELVSQIPYGTELTLLDTNSGWGKVKYMDQIGWVNLAFASIYLPGRWTVDPFDESMQTIELKESPDKSAKEIARVPAQESFSIEQFKNGWGKVTFQKKTGWIKMNQLIFSPNE